MAATTLPPRRRTLSNTSSTVAGRRSRGPAGRGERPRARALRDDAPPRRQPRGLHRGAERQRARPPPSTSAASAAASPPLPPPPARRRRRRRAPQQQRRARAPRTLELARPSAPAAVELRGAPASSRSARTRIEWAERSRLSRGGSRVAEDAAEEDVAQPHRVVCRRRLGREGVVAGRPTPRASPSRRRSESRPPARASPRSCTRSGTSPPASARRRRARAGIGAPTPSPPTAPTASPTCRRAAGSRRRRCRPRRASAAMPSAIDQHATSALPTSGFIHVSAPLLSRWYWVWPPGWTSCSFGLNVAPCLVLSPAAPRAS